MTLLRNLVPGFRGCCIWLWASLFGMLCLPAPPVLNAQDQQSSSLICLGRVESVQGTVILQTVQQPKWVALKQGDCLPPGAVIRVEALSRAALYLRDHTLLRLDQNSTLRMPAEKEPKPLWLELLEGAAHFFSRTPRQLKVVTPFLNASIEGTEFFVRVGSSETFLTIFEGQVLATNAVGEQILTQGQSAVAEADKAPVLKVMADARESVHWTLHYPSIFKPKAPGAYQQAWRRLAQNDLQGALEQLESLPAADRQGEFYLARASLLLAGGRAAQAGDDLDELLAQNPRDADALGLKAMLAVVQGRKAQALELAQQAVAAGPDSAAAHLALSYARQARFDIPGALAAVAQAASAAPQNALVKARLAELYLSTGELERALEAAEQAVALDPDIARTQSVLGFARLTQIKTKPARQAFERAMALDPADPLPRLGLGLAMIREGELATGREQIEVAAALDPGSALIRSYLGKAYFEEKRDKHAASQLTLAKQLDPNDPTPWFYDAIRKQSINRPVEALHDLQRSIDLNDNRAVYRSRLLLDEDLAARSASLGRIYRDLGFEQLALVEGWKSVNTDPANYSAHRFLADSYSALPRHEIARVSELLQSQLLQPLNTTPIQPSLAESNRFTLEGAGPAEPAFNEFNPLFMRNRLALLANGLAAGNGTWGDDLVFSGVWGRNSW
ncbi:MAG: tetratricopeptide repeat protein, partial [Desulfobacterales bacterium]